MKAFEKFKYWFHDSAIYRHFLSAIIHPKNFMFLNRYPFWKMRNIWVQPGRFCGYDSSMYDWIPEGWRKAFGKDLTHDIANALEADGIRRGKWSECLQWQDIKEKYGGLRLYASTTDKVQEVLSRYECLSIGYCINCGKPARYITSGWIEYICEDCERANPKEADDRLTAGDIPHYYTYESGKEVEETPLERFGINLRKIWGLDDRKKG